MGSNRTESVPRIVFGDLDGAQVVSSADPWLSDQKGSPAYVSPEVLSFAPYDGAAADMWTLGVILYVLLAGGYPFHETNPAALLQRIQGGYASVVFPDYFSADARALVCSLLQRDPLLRPISKTLLVHPWLQPESPCSIRRRKPAGFSEPLGDGPHPLETRDQLFDTWEQIVPLSCVPAAAAAAAAVTATVREADQDASGNKSAVLSSPLLMPEASFFADSDNVKVVTSADSPRPKRLFRSSMLSIDQTVK
jgi:serine/threonine protein kinase